MKIRDPFFKKWRGIIYLFSLLLAPSLGIAQTITVIGEVKDPQGNSLPNVSVILKSSKVGTATDNNGKFSLSVTKNDVIVFSSTGYTSQEVQINGSSSINIVLYPEESTLDDIVVVGYGTMKKSDLTGASSAIKGSELRKAPVQSSAEAITGRLAGVQVQKTDGQPGADIMIKIRGGTSISQDNSPLYVIDGFPSEEGLNQVSPQDIERIDILKDASSTAIYGARGANGVVLITTKSGKEGPGQVTYDGYAGVKRFAKKLDVLNPYEYAVYQYERSRSSVANMDRFLQKLGTWESLENYKNIKGIDWQEEAFGGSHYHQSHNIGINGGSKTTKYRIGYSRDDEDGLLVSNGYSRNYFKLKLDQKVSEKMTFSTNLMYSQTDIKGAGTAGSQDKGKLKNAIMYKPIQGLTGSLDELLELDFDPEVSLTNINTQALAQQRLKDNRNTVINLSLDYILAKGLTLRTMGGMSLDANRSEEFDTFGSSDTRSAGGPFGGISFLNATKYSNTNLLIYQTRLNNKHQINATLGQEYVFNDLKTVGVFASMYDSDDIGINNLGLGNEFPRPGSRVETDKLLSYFGRVFYSYSGKYLFTGTLRTDGSSKFINANRWGNFPSLAFAWHANKEDFMKDLNVFSDLKFRFSYGVAGNNRITNNSYSSTFTNTAYAANGTNLSVALIPNRLANPELKWESTYSKNIGLDVGLFNNRVVANVDLFHNTTEDLLLNANIPSNSGYTTQFKNVGSTLSKGIELTLSTANISKRDFRWTTDFNISFAKTVVTGLNNENGFKQESFLTPSNYAINIIDYLVKVGEPIGMIYGYVTEGFYGVDDFNYAPSTQVYTLKNEIAAPSTLRSTIQPGDIKFKDLGGGKDVNGYADINDDDDRTILGRTAPKFFGGLNNTFSYKGFDLSIFANFSVGNKILNANKIIFTTAYNDYSNVLGISRDRWMTVNSNGEVVTDPDELRNLNKDATMWKWMGGLPRYTHSWAVEDGSFLRINNITLGFTFSKALAQKMHIKSLRVYATAYNIYTFTNYSGFDPEINTRRSSPFTPGVDHSGFPRSFSAIGGLNIIF
ncbi:MAG TPA: TonB-dependent receptor [Hanamia sp.]